MALKLYLHPLASYCWKVLIALYEAETPFAAVHVDFGDPAAREAFLKLAPTGKMPVLLDEALDAVVGETSIIIDYLAHHHPGRERLIPHAADPAREVRLWDRIFDLYVHDTMQRIVADRLRPEGQGDPFGVAQAHEQLRSAYAMIERRLAGRTWAAGEAFSMADCAAAPALFYAAIVRPFPPGHARLEGYFERLMARPSVLRTITEARPWFRYFPLREAIPARFLAENAGAG